MKIKLLLATFLLPCMLAAQVPQWLWAVNAGGYYSEVAFAVTPDPFGNWYATGAFGSSSIIFGTDTLVNNGDEDIFLVKFDAMGNVIWARHAGGNMSEFGYGVQTDAAGNCYITGGYESALCVFDPTHTLVNANPPNYDIFIAKYDPNGNVQWVKSAGGSSYEWTNAISTDAAGNSYIAGAFFSDSLTFDSITLISAGSSDLFMAKYDPSGNLVWARREGGTGDERAHGIAQDENGHFYMTGYFIGNLTIGSTVMTGAGSGDVLLTKYDTAGNPLWARNVGGMSDDAAMGVATDAFGNCYIAGYFESVSVTFGATTLTNQVSSYNTFLVKYDSTGAALWAQQSVGNGDDLATSVAVDGAGNVFITGRFESVGVVFGSYALYNATATGNVNDIFLVKYDSAGTVIWGKKAGGPGDDRGYAVAANGAGNCMPGGSFISPSLVLDSITLSNQSGNSYWDIYVGLIDHDAVGIGELPRAENSLHVYPNPSEGRIMITPPSAEGKFEVLNVAGQLVHTWKSANAAATTVDLGFLEDGIYFLRFVSGETESVEKIAITR